LVFVEAKGQTHKTQEKVVKRVKSRKLMVGYEESGETQPEFMLNREKRRDYVTFSYVFREKVR